MSRQKPPDVSWDAWIEHAIREAQDSGQFEGLSGRGRPLPDYGRGYDPDWWVKQLMEREKVSVLPPALAIRQRVASELARIGKLRRESDVRLALEALNEEIRRTNRTVHAGPMTTTAPIDVERFLARWREIAPEPGSSC